MNTADAAKFAIGAALVLLFGGIGEAIAADPIDAGSRWLWDAPKAVPPASRPSPNGDAEAANYARCLNLAKTDAGAARDLAQSWQKRGGAHPADHCYAVALIGLKQYKDAATRLEKLQLE